MDVRERVLCRYDGGRKGPLFICLGGVHGNEPAGVEAIQIVGKLLLNEPTVNPQFEFHGRLLGLVGNMQAMRTNQRFIDADMNRILRPEYVNQIMRSESNAFRNEAREIRELVSTVRNEIETYNPEKVVVLDIHSTSARGGIFVITADHPESIRIGTELHAPVVLDFAQQVLGTTLGYFSPDNFDCNIVTVVFESGQHTEPLSVNRSIAAIINCMRTIGCVSPDAVENRHDHILREYSEGLPKISRLIEKFEIPEGGQFKMARPYQNFEEIRAGETVAFLDGHPIQALHDGLILLPRLQELGNDGFFVVAPVVTNQYV